MGTGQVQFSEFVTKDRRVPLLLCLIFFHQLDTNHDGVLDNKEFTFKSKAGDAFYRMNADGTGWKRLFRFRGLFQNRGQPKVCRRMEKFWPLTTKVRMLAPMIERY